MKAALLGVKNPQQGYTRTPITHQCICCMVQKLNPATCEVVYASFGAKGFVDTN
jgi:hypothetical protein